MDEFMQDIDCKIKERALEINRLEKQLQVNQKELKFYTYIYKHGKLQRTRCNQTNVSVYILHSIFVYLFEINDMWFFKN